MSSRDTDRKEALLVFLLGIVPVVWLALLIAPYAGSVAEIIGHVGEIFAEPFRIRFVKGSIRTVLLLLAFYGLGMGVYISTRGNYRRGEEHGSAGWGDARIIGRKYRQFPVNMNKILTQKVCIGLDGKRHRRNLNVLVIGGSGAGKTRFYCKPNLMQANSSFIVLDPKIAVF